MSQITKPKMVVLLSAGLDSTYNLYRAWQEGEVVLALTFDYGQRAAEKEIQEAASICRKLSIPHKVMTLDFFKEFQSSSLLNRDMAVPVGQTIQIDDKEASEASAKSVWVPNRNGIFLNIGAGFAEALNADFVIPGFNKEEAQTFPDNSEQYMTKLDASFSLSTANHVTVKCYSVNMDKTEIVADAKIRQMPFENVWPCYFAQQSLCGECESCQRYLRALNANGMTVDAS